jgi:hypothetical protein
MLIDPELDSCDLTPIKQQTPHTVQASAGPADNSAAHQAASVASASTAVTDSGCR